MLGGFFYLFWDREGKVGSCVSLFLGRTIAKSLFFFIRSWGVWRRSFRF